MNSNAHSLKETPVPLAWNISNVIIIALFHAFAATGVVFAILGYVSWKTMVFALFLYWFSGFGITGGLHRYWSHRSHDAKAFLKYFYLFAATTSFVGSVIWWARDHRIHHKFSETDKDPHDANRGFWYSHIGWLLLEKPQTVRNAKDAVDMKDLYSDRSLVFQHKHYFVLSFLCGIVLPALISGLFWHDWLGGVFFAGFSRIVWVWHCTFLVNSAAHKFGKRPFLDINPAENLLVALLTHGEGWHNFHHAYPFDYRASSDLKKYNPTGWAILLFAKMGLASNLKQNRKTRGKNGPVS